MVAGFYQVCYKWILPLDTCIEEIKKVCISFTTVQCNSSGIAAYIKALRPEIKVIGVEADDAAGETSQLTNDA